MEEYLIWGFIHILLFVFWLGADVGVFLSALFAKNAKLGFEARMTALRLGLTTDLLPRMCFALMPAVGLHLTASVGLADFPMWAFVAAWALGAVWIWVILAISKSEGSPLAVKLGHAQVGFEAIAGTAITGVGLWSLIGDGPIAERWFALKITLFGGVFFLAIVIDFCSRPLVKPFLEIGQEGSTPEREAAVTGSINNTLVAVSILYVLIIVIAFLGKVKPI